MSINETLLSIDPKAMNNPSGENFTLSTVPAGSKQSINPPILLIFSKVRISI